MTSTIPFHGTADTKMFSADQQNKAPKTRLRFWEIDHFFKCPGEYQPVIWAAASSRELPLYCKREVFGDVHMTMHQNTADFIKLQKEASALRKKIAAVQ